MKKINKKMLLVFIGIAIIGIGVSIEYMDIGGQYKRLNFKKTSLLLVRSSVQEFKEIQGRWPVSLTEVADYARNHPENNWHCNMKEYISSRRGNSSEHSSLNDQGGWYYNKDTGEVRINLTKPLKKYLYFYFGSDRDEIPSDW